VFDLPRSGKPDELFAKYGIDSAAIVRKVKALEGLALAERYERKGCTR
jgi:hypothetical protein